MTLEQGQAFEQLARAATQCRECFERHEVVAPDINVAQPRWIGPEYWGQAFRVAILMLNPGQSGATPQALDYLRRIRAFRDGEVPLQPILDRQREGMKQWGRAPGVFTDFYLKGLGLELDNIAFANIAWCGTKGNKYPGTMLSRCYTKHTGPLLALLQPTVVILSGNKTHDFAREVRRTVPKASTVAMLHYAHREGGPAEQAEFTRVRQVLASARASTSGSAR